ncbi:DUF6314 family protein [Pseudooceanicola onchidii]|uniref:DUF6314 family protein n=1 Tax=Pseudooceanicola onchidii TaxID=2562279 RepID=UPI0010AB287F|nr:DUF6314 family protein [Pseudooceanicola onchidii]
MDLNDFEGLWRIDRRITNAVGPDAVFTGTARFTARDDGLLMEEEGEMRMDGAPPMRASRRYLWRAAATGIDVFFDDGRYFHHIAPDTRPADRHDCAPDLYRVSYDFSGWPVWSSVWRVTGPRKDYAMHSHFTRG